MATAATLRQDACTMGLVGLAHGTSHFFHLMLPPLFPLFVRDFGVSYSELGLLMTAFFAVSGVGQASGGFVVDRFGARPVLYGALGCFALAAFVTAGAEGFGGLVLGAALAGLGNAPFHPVDFTILNRRVSASRLGHAFSVHGISGNLGWAAAPVVMTGISAISGSWRVAAVAAGVWALVVLGLLRANREAIDDGHRRPVASDAEAAGHAQATHVLAFLRLPSVWLCFLFFFWSTCGLSAVQAFAGPALAALYGLPLGVTAFVVTGFMLCGAAGMLAGGFAASRTERLEQQIGVFLVGSALLLALAATGWLPGPASALAVVAAGFGAGLAGPSRDMLIRRAAPPGATGRVYGTVYSGLDLGFALAAPVFGAVLDGGAPAWVLYGAALSLLVAVAAADRVATQLRPQPLARAA